MDSNNNRQHPVIDALDKTRQEHPHAHPAPSHNPSAPLSSHVGKDVTDEILEQSEAVHIPNDHDNNNNNIDNNADNKEKEKEKEKLIGLSTTATLPAPTWEPLASKSSNQLPASSAIPGHLGHGYGAQDHHDKPSVLPEILPGFKDRMADIHHATLKSIADVTTSSAGGEGGEGGKWSGGTMFPAMTGGFKNPFGGSSTSGAGSVSQQQQQHVESATATEDANRRIARSSILYESSDLEESTTKLTDDDDTPTATHTTTTTTGGGAAGGRRPSSTLVQGGQGGRRWSHELSPEKAGLVGSVLSVAGLVKDVVLDKIQQHPPTSSSSSASTHDHRHMTTEEKQLAAGAAFGGSEESGDQTILMDGLLHRQQHDAERTAAAASELDVISGVAATSPSTQGVEAEQVLRAAPSAGQEHHKSIFHLAANPETKKSLLLNHPEALGYHGVTKELLQEDSTLTALGAQHQRNVVSGQDVSKTSR
ncbi:hypothetical protein BGW39_008642 [Mortierella sp. 14UC]|nr:hypothetical protein BGW39_008642 [Mortierella sp. 14UC]